MPEAPEIQPNMSLCPQAQKLVAAAWELRWAVSTLVFQGVHVYNPLEYAWGAHLAYLAQVKKQTEKRFVLVGMNPGPFGMMQTGVPFGEISAVRDWMGIDVPPHSPVQVHPKRPILGFQCTRSEISGRRLWGWAAHRFVSAEQFFKKALVLNYCPLAFLEPSGRNFTPNKLPLAERLLLQQACDRHMKQALVALAPSWAIGIGNYATERLTALDLASNGIAVERILHPSPANPAANKGWAQAVDEKLMRLGVLL